RVRLPPKSRQRPLVMKTCEKSMNYWALAPNKCWMLNKHSGNIGRNCGLFFASWLACRATSAWHTQLFNRQRRVARPWIGGGAHNAKQHIIPGDCSVAAYAATLPFHLGRPVRDLPQTNNGLSGNLLQRTL